MANSHRLFFIIGLVLLCALLIVGLSRNAFGQEEDLVRLDVFVGRHDSSTRGKWQGTRRVPDYAGWRVLVLRGVLDLASPAAPAFEVFFLPGAGDPRSGGQPMSVGRFALGLG